MEFASIYLAYCGFGELNHDNITNFLKIDWDLAQQIMAKLFDFYFEGKDEDFKASVLEKAKVLGYARVLRRTIKRDPDNKEYIDYYRKQLIDYVAKTDTLLY